MGTPMTEQEEMAMLAENAALKEKLSEMNRRCQQAESAALVKVEDCKRQGISLGRGLANWHGSKLQRDLDAALLQLSAAKECESIAREQHNLADAECKELKRLYHELIDGIRNALLAVNDCSSFDQDQDKEQRKVIVALTDALKKVGAVSDEMPTLKPKGAEGVCPLCYHNYNDPAGKCPDHAEKRKGE